MKIKVKTDIKLFYFKLKKVNGITINGYIYPKNDDMKQAWNNVISYDQNDEEDFFDKICFRSKYDSNDIDNLPNYYGYIVFDLEEETAFYFKLKYGKYIV